MTAKSGWCTSPLDDLGRGCGPEYATWLRQRADRNPTTEGTPT